MKKYNCKCTCKIKADYFQLFFTQTILFRKVENLRFVGTIFGWKQKSQLRGYLFILKNDYEIVFFVTKKCVNKNELR